jgi:hypothetical protein
LRSYRKTKRKAKAAPKRKFKPSPRPKPAASTISASLVDYWNGHHPQGTPVRYWNSVRNGQPATGESVTRAPAFVNDGIAVVQLVNLPGLFPITKVEAIEA